jgi:hypothetical protein
MNSDYLLTQHQPLSQCKYLTWIGGLALITSERAREYYWSIFIEPYCISDRYLVRVEPLNDVMARQRVEAILSVNRATVIGLNLHVLN